MRMQFLKALGMCALALSTTDTFAAENTFVTKTPAAINYISTENSIYTASNSPSRIPAPGSTMGVGDDVQVIIEAELSGPAWAGAKTAETH